jgi:hypothetical protein
MKNSRCQGEIDGSHKAYTVVYPVWGILSFLRVWAELVFIPATSLEWR